MNGPFQGSPLTIIICVWVLAIVEFRRYIISALLVGLFASTCLKCLHTETTWVVFSAVSLLPTLVLLVVGLLFVVLVAIIGLCSDISNNRKRQEDQALRQRAWLQSLEVGGQWSEPPLADQWHRDKIRKDLNGCTYCIRGIYPDYVSDYLVTVDNNNRVTSMERRDL